MPNYPGSLDFERVVNEYSIQATRDRIQEQAPQSEKLPLTYQTFQDVPPPPPPPPAQPHRPPLRAYSGRKATRWFLIILTGLLTGLLAIFIVTCTSTIETWRSRTLDKLYRTHWIVFVLYAVFNLTLALLSGTLSLLQPQAVGSGIPEVKACLNGVRVERFSSIGLLLVKIVGTILSVSSGLVLGPEGPLVHIGAIIGSALTKLHGFLLQLPWTHSLLWSLLSDLSHFSSDRERRDLVSIGAAAGFSAAFGAPIGGLLFSMEEASSYYEHALFLKTLVATAVATFCLAIHHGNLSNYSIISLGEFRTFDGHPFFNRVEETPLYVLVGLVGGLMGGLFCHGWRLLNGTRGLAGLWTIAWISLLTSVTTYFLPLMEWTCRKTFDGTGAADDDGGDWESNAYQFNCPNGHIDELATIFFGSREDSISAILTNPAQFQPAVLLCVGVLFFGLMILTVGLRIPSGIFMPTFLIGSSLGGAAGIVFQQWLGEEVSPATFAALGAAALLTGIQRSPVSICVILVEGTGQVKILIPVIITVVVARYVGDLVSDGFYEMALAAKFYPYLDHEEKTLYDVLQVRSIMSTPVVSMGPRIRAYHAVKLLRETDHHGFPVIDPHSKRFLGLVRRDQLVALLECGVFDEDEDDTDSSAHGSSSAATPEWTPRPGVTKTPLMHLAYHITDDRYDHVATLRSVSTKTLEKDEFDANAWLVSVRQSRVRLDELLQADESADVPIDMIGDESLPPVALSETVFLKGNHADLIAVVDLNEKGNVYISYLHPDCRRKWIHVAGVHNRGTYCVTDTMPVSKAHHLFTLLGLRHLVVLGEGGNVVGILTRKNLLKESIQERTGMRL